MIGDGVIIVIDAYNYIKSISSDRFVDEAIINKWIFIFQKYAALRGNKVVLVFDAGPFFYPTTDNYGGVQVLFSGQRQTADDLLKVWVEQHARQDVLLVTSDRQIRDHAARSSVESISSQDFYKIFNAVTAQQEVSEQLMHGSIYKTKLEEKEDDDLDSLMELGSRSLVDARNKNEYDISVRMPRSSQESKADKKILKKINKI